MITLTQDVNFVGRGEELLTLENLWERDNATLFVLYGRRRVGKTRLLTHWQKQHDGEALYWVAEPTNSRSQLNSLSRALFQFEFPNRQGFDGYTFSSWEKLFSYIGQLASERKIAIILDEFNYLIDADPDIVGTIQKLWDQDLKDKNLMLSLSGSSMKQMHEHIMAYSAPLYGRATTSKNLDPLPYGVMPDYFSGLSPAERVSIYAMLGGIPAYWERFPEASFSESVRALVSNSYMLDEPLVLLRDHIEKPAQYSAILEAIAIGDNTMKKMETYTFLRKSHLTKYLSVLRTAEFVARITPATDPTNNRKSMYKITDPFLRFYYAFLSQYRSDLARGGYEKVVDMIEDRLPAFIAKNTWPELCREWLAMKSAFSEMENEYEVIDAAWAAQWHIDVVGLNRRDKTAFLGTCFWEDRPIEAGDLNLAMNNATQALGKDGSWHVTFAAFSKSGFSESAIQLVEEVGQGMKGTGWTSNMFQLYTLEQVDEDLRRLVRT